MKNSPAFALLADLDLYEDAMRTAAEAPGPRAADADALLRDLRAHAQQLPPLQAHWRLFEQSHARTLAAFAGTDAVGARLDALEQHIGVMLDLQRRCLELMGGEPEPH